MSIAFSASKYAQYPAQGKINKQKMTMKQRNQKSIDKFHQTWYGYVTDQVHR